MEEQYTDIVKKEVFICYRGEKELVFAAGFQLYYALEKLGVSSFFAPITLKNGDNFYEKVPEYFEKVKAVVVMLTPDFFVEHKQNGEDVVFRELECAFANPRIQFFPVVIPGFAGEAEYVKGRKHFSEDDLGRIKHQSTSNYNTPYDNTIDALAKSVKQSLENGFENVLVRSLGFLPDDDTSRDFDVSVTSLAEKLCTDKNIDEDLLSVIESYGSDRVGYKAYYCLNIMYRHIKAYDKMREVIKKYHDIYEIYPSSGHLLGLFYLETGEELDRDELIDATYRNRIAYDGNAGYVHLFADILVTLYERSFASDKEEFRAKWLDIALSAVDRAIELDQSYAKYHCTKGRILAMSGRYNEADISINRAISLENPKKNDYVLRISNYYYHKTMINTARLLFEHSGDKSGAGINA